MRYPFLPFPGTYIGFRASKNGPFGTKNGLTWQACQSPDVVQKGPKWSQMVNITCFWPFGTIWTHLHHFGPFKTKINFSPQKHKVLLGQSSLEQKIKFCLKWSKRVQMSPKMSQMVKNMLYWPFGTIWDPFGPHRGIGKPAMLGHFWSQMGHFWTPGTLYRCLEMAKKRCTHQ